MTANEFEQAIEKYLADCLRNGMSLEQAKSMAHAEILRAHAILVKERREQFRVVGSAGP
jgi:hypothetical protein